MTRRVATPKLAVESLNQIVQTTLDEAQPGARTRDIAEATIDRRNSSLEPLAREWAIEDDDTPAPEGGATKADEQTGAEEQDQLTGRLMRRCSIIDSYSVLAAGPAVESTQPAPCTPFLSLLLAGTEVALDDTLDPCA